MVPLIAGLISVTAPVVADGSAARPVIVVVDELHCLNEDAIREKLPAVPPHTRIDVNTADTGGGMASIDIKVWVGEELSPQSRVLVIDVRDCIDSPAVVALVVERAIAGLPNRVWEMVREQGHPPSASPAAGTEVPSSETEVRDEPARQQRQPRRYALLLGLGARAIGGLGLSSSYYGADGAIDIHPHFRSGRFSIGPAFVLELSLAPSTRIPPDSFVAGASARLGVGGSATFSDWTWLLLLKGGAGVFAGFGFDQNVTAVAPLASVHLGMRQQLWGPLFVGASIEAPIVQARFVVENGTAAAPALVTFGVSIGVFGDAFFGG